MRLIYLLPLLWLLSCGSEPSADTEQTSTPTETVSSTEAEPAPEPASTPEESSNAIPAEVPRSGGCNFLSDQQILSIITSEIEDTNISNSPGRTVSACYYRLDNLRWSGDLVIEVLDGYDAGKLLEQIEQAKAVEKVTIGGHPAQLLQGNRILRVAAAPPYELKLSILPKAGYKEYADETDRKRMLTEMAELMAKR